MTFDRSKIPAYRYLDIFVSFPHRRIMFSSAAAAITFLPAQKRDYIPTQVYKLRTITRHSSALFGFFLNSLPPCRTVPDRATEFVFFNFLIFNFLIFNFFVFLVEFCTCYCARFQFLKYFMATGNHTENISGLIIHRHDSTLNWYNKNVVGTAVKMGTWPKGP